MDTECSSRELTSNMVTEPGGFTKVSPSHAASPSFADNRICPGQNNTSVLKVKLHSASQADAITE
eukprot:3674-Rhodomonas_salina.1